MALWDSTDDADIPFTAVDGVTDTLTLPANRKLIVWTGKGFEPNGNVTISGGGAGADYDGTLELYADGTFDATGSETHTVGGSLIMGSGATLDDETSTFVFTSSGSSRTIDTNDLDLFNITFNGTGSWIITNSNTVVGNDFTITQGAVTLSTGTTTIGGSFMNNGGSFSYNGGSVNFTSSIAETIRVNGSTFGTTTFNGSGSWVYQDSAATSTGNLTILQGSVTAPSGVLTVGGDFINNDTFAHNTGTLRMKSSFASSTITLSGSDLGSLVH
jgi:fibronectin-binding autotransporter adhesin